MPKDTIAEEVRRFAKFSREFRKRIKKDPEVAKDFLIRAGIAVRSAKSESGIVLAKKFR